MPLTLTGGNNGNSVLPPHTAVGDDDGEFFRTHEERLTAELPIDTLEFKIPWPPQTPPSESPWQAHMRSIGTRSLCSEVFPPLFSIHGLLYESSRNSYVHRSSNN